MTSLPLSHPLQQASCPNCQLLHYAYPDLPLSTGCQDLLWRRKIARCKNYLDEVAAAMNPTLEKPLAFLRFFRYVISMDRVGVENMGEPRKWTDRQSKMDEKLQAWTLSNLDLCREHHEAQNKQRERLEKWASDVSYNRHRFLRKHPHLQDSLCPDQLDRLSDTIVELKPKSVQGAIYKRVEIEMEPESRL